MGEKREQFGDADYFNGGDDKIFDGAIGEYDQEVIKK